MDTYLKIIIQAETAIHELLIAELEALGFDSFQELDDQLEAYILEQLYDEKSLKIQLKKYSLEDKFSEETVPAMNWNEEWEKNFSPVYIGNAVQIRASFHNPLTQYPYDIVINPKMSFGTGHHETTHLIVELQLGIDHSGKDILDIGTGTGILSIMAHKRGARSVTATDIDDWSIANCRENFELNGVQNFRIIQGTADKLTQPEKYPVIFANINKNVLLAEMPHYKKLLAPNGTLILSGFYEHDIDDLADSCAAHSLKINDKKSRNFWAALVIGHH